MGKTLSWEEGRERLSKTEHSYLYKLWEEKEEMSDVECNLSLLDVCPSRQGVLLRPGSGL